MTSVSHGHGFSHGFSTIAMFFSRFRFSPTGDVLNLGAPCSNYACSSLRPLTQSGATLTYRQTYNPSTLEQSYGPLPQRGHIQLAIIVSAPLSIYSRYIAHTADTVYSDAAYTLYSAIHSPSEPRQKTRKPSKNLRTPSVSLRLVEDAVGLELAQLLGELGVARTPATEHGGLVCRFRRRSGGDR